MIDILLIPFIQQHVVQQDDGNWYIVAEDARPADPLSMMRLDYSRYEYIYPVRGIRVPVSRALNEDLPKIRYVVHFRSSGTRIDASVKETLRALAKKYDHFLVIGYADREGDASINLTLSRIRARKVAEVLKHAGAAYVEVRAYGESQPVCEEDTRACKDLNRRVVVRARKEGGA